MPTIGQSARYQKKVASGSTGKKSSSSSVVSTPTTSSPKPFNIMDYVTPGREAEARAIISGGTATKPTNSLGQTAPIGANDLVTSQNYGSVMNYLSPYMTSAAQEALAKGNEPISLTELQKYAPISLPTPVTTDYFSTLNAGMAGLTTPTTTTPAETSQDALFKQYMTAKEENQMPSLSDQYAKAEKQADIEEKQTQVNDLTAQLNSITAEAQVAQQTLESQAGTGKDVTGTFLGRQQQEISRQLTIKALPIQAELAAAQGNLQYAQDRLTTLFNLKVQDAQNQYTYMNNYIDSIYEYATKKEQAQLDAKKDAEARAFTLYRDNISYARDLSNSAMSNSQPTLAANIARLDPSSSTFMSDLANYTGQLSVGGGGNNLTPAQINSSVNTIASAFDNEAIVKEYNTVKNYTNAFNSYGTSATDDQARIYAFAKIMDPNSVVRESEYKTVADYSQALLLRTGINVARVFTSTGVLSQGARDAMSKTLATKLKTQEGAYNQVRNEYQRQIDDAYAGKPRAITQYNESVVFEPESKEEATFLDTINNTGGYWSNLWKSIIGK